MPNESLSEWLIRARSANGLTQRDLAAKVGLAFSMISKYETGHSVPRATTLMKLRAALEPCQIEPSKQRPEEDLEALVDRWIAVHSLPPQIAAKMLALHVARLL